MTDTITLTREQWNDLFDSLDLIRDRYDALFDIAAALTALGLDRPAGTITAVQEEMNNEISRLQMTLFSAEDGKPYDLMGRRLKRDLEKIMKPSTKWEA